MRKQSVNSLSHAATAHLVALVIGDPQVQRPLRRLRQLPSGAPVLRSARQGVHARMPGPAPANAPPHRPLVSARYTGCALTRRQRLRKPAASLCAAFLRSDRGATSAENTLAQNSGARCSWSATTRRCPGTRPWRWRRCPPLSETHPCVSHDFRVQRLISHTAVSHCQRVSGAGQAVTKVIATQRLSTPPVRSKYCIPRPPAPPSRRCRGC